ncbi:uncharacterized protein Triagg1_9982 [Trichoderma aggressivum f. europaeum]|uniref:Uncharacterized protein n=1 Tax=Trichoderma aggressivum f. europaeum TaxID=173218 RepID=A0AAE1I801_9HYPO|nr:hypothetical protein Triagg1_9982 [Trichoderma aggressivum f. europaeum]
MELSAFDDNFVNRSVNVSLLLVFDAILDAERLHSTLEALVRSEHWNRISAERKTRNGRMILCQSENPDDSVSPIEYMHTVQKSRIFEHPKVAKLLGTPTVPTVLGTITDIQDTLCLSVEGFGKRLDKQLGLHVVSFLDATSIILRWHHTLCDATGMGLIVQAWTAMLRSDPAGVPNIMSTNVDHLADVGRNPPEPHYLESQRMTFLGSLAKLTYENLGGIFSGWETRAVCLPAAFLKNYRAHAEANLDYSGQGHKPEFLTDGDLISAWWARLLISSQTSTPSDRSVLINNAVSYRSALQPNPLPEIAGFLPNAVGFATAMITVKDVLEKNVSYIACAVRDSILKARTRGQIEAYASLLRNSPQQLFPLFGSASTSLVFVTNWSKSNFWATTFSGAEAGDVARDNTGQVGSGLPRIFAAWPTPNFMNGMIILGKDAVGNYWVNITLTAKLWNKFEPLMKKETERIYASTS